jgi:hypothetical protein
VLAAARAGSSTLTALIETVVLDPAVDWIAAKRAAAADRGLDSAMALRLWLSHLQETLPDQFERLSELTAQVAPVLEMVEEVGGAAALAETARHDADVVAR